ncbi:AMP-dependent synthetase/ligase [Sphingobacterium faecium]|uniref:AMP-dependent synthetase/ligase n=1 Tax=Sphingobacterium faecium TaxID=34087 RepID=UPI00097F3642|nr:long-chain fatty acid--CoA ligase [Sphingobacterium faecium]WGQ15828.1 long-chain fatty acid--CoA ligase [Sphingobacterium faecium]SJN48724.1 Long-chain-fatty-acid--CoA ligase [Sphingobacterium faecium PCAi_F2.5]
MEQKLRIFDLADRQLELYPNLAMFSSKTDGDWNALTTSEFVSKVNAISKGLIELGVKPNEKVGLIAESGIHWHIVDFAIQQIGAVVVAIYPNITDADYQYIFNDAEIRVTIVSTKSLYQRIVNLKDSIYTLKYIFCIEEHDQIRNWSEIVQIGRHIEDREVQSLKDQIRSTDLVTLIYTSGTTGKPKGVMLSHDNIIANVRSATEITPCKAYDRGLTFLPPCHAYERMVIYTYFYLGITVYIAESFDKIGQNLMEIRPNIMTAVPRILEKVYEKIIKKGHDLNGIKRKIFDWAVSVGEKYDPVPENRSFLYDLKLNLARKLVLNKWYEGLGGSLQTVAFGSASLQSKLIRVFLAAGIPIYEGYGMTEASPLIAVNHYIKGIRVGTVGPAVKDVQIKLASDGEILVKGPNVMMGYYKNPEETNKTIIDGWLYTGDIGVWEDGIFLKIIDRKKELFKISGGKYVTPQPIEKKLVESKFIEQAMVVGEGMKFASAFIVPDYGHLVDWFKSEDPSLLQLSKTDFLKADKVIKKINQEVRIANQHFGNWEQIKRPIIIAQEFTIDGGELTPTLKLKRKMILQKYKYEYDQLYHSVTD